MLIARTGLIPNNLRLTFYGPIKVMTNCLGRILMMNPVLAIYTLVMFEPTILNCSYNLYQVYSSIIEVVCFLIIMPRLRY